MAIFHCHAKYFSRKKGQSATRAAAYRAGERILDERTGEIADYTRKAVAHAEIITPDGSPAPGRAELWNKAEKLEKRKDATVAREIEIALPVELTPTQRQDLARELAHTIARAENCVVDVCIHENQGNPHAHFLTPTRQGVELGPKINATVSKAERERRGLTTTPDEDLAALRAQIADQINNALERAGVDQRVTAGRLTDREPTIHEGPTARAMAARGEDSERTAHNQAVRTRNRERAKHKPFRFQRPKPQARLEKLPTLGIDVSQLAHETTGPKPTF